MRSARSPASAPSSARPVTSRVSRVMAAPMSTTSPSRQPATSARERSAAIAPYAAIRARWNAGCSIRRRARCSGSSLVSTFVPSTSRRIAAPGERPKACWRSTKISRSRNGSSMRYSRLGPTPKAVTGPCRRACAARNARVPAKDPPPKKPSVSNPRGPGGTARATVIAARFAPPRGSSARGGKWTSPCPVSAPASSRRCSA